MKRLVCACIVSLGSLVGTPYIACAQDGFVLIVNQANPVGSLRLADVSKMFLRKQTKWPNGERIEPVDQSVTSAARRRFSAAVHGMDVPSVKSYWQTIVFSGRGEPPPERASDADVIAFVHGHVNGFGYVSPDAPLAGVKVVPIVRNPE
jgi:ABC-type phosphate transport system substrate-binding protein